MPSLKSVLARALSALLRRLDRRVVVVEPGEGLIHFADFGTGFIYPKLESEEIDENATLAIANILLVRGIQVLLDRADSPHSLSEGIMQGAFEMGFPPEVGEALLESMVICADQRRQGQPPAPMGTGSSVDLHGLFGIKPSGEKGEAA